MLMRSFLYFSDFKAPLMRFDCWFVGVCPCRLVTGRAVPRLAVRTYLSPDLLRLCAVYDNNPGRTLPFHAHMFHPRIRSSDSRTVR